MNSQQGVTSITCYYHNKSFYSDNELAVFILVSQTIYTVPVHIARNVFIAMPHILWLSLVVIMECYVRVLAHTHITYL